MSVTNPFTLAYEALWDCLERRSEFTSLVRASNRIKMTETDAGANRDPWDRLKNIRSFPSVAIVPIARPESEVRIEADANTTDVEKWFGVYVGSGDRRLDDLFELEFVIIRAFASWRETVGAVQWKDSDCILDCSVFHHPEELDKKLIERGIRNWTTVLAGRLWFYFATSDLTSSSSGED